MTPNFDVSLFCLRIVVCNCFHLVDNLILTNHGYLNGHLALSVKVAYQVTVNTFVIRSVF